MSWVKGFALVTCLATPLAVINATVASADPAPAATTPAPAATTTPAAPAAPATAAPEKPAMSDADKRAKAADCSKQADAQKLHGERRKKFRAECKRK